MEKARTQIEHMFDVYKQHQMELEALMEESSLNHREN